MFSSVQWLSRIWLCDPMNRSTPGLEYCVSMYIYAYNTHSVVHSCLAPSCDPMDCSLSGLSVPVISQARILKWVVISYSGDLPSWGTEPMSPAWQSDSLPCVTWEPLCMYMYMCTVTIMFSIFFYYIFDS